MRAMLDTCRRITYCVPPLVHSCSLHGYDSTRYLSCVTEVAAVHSLLQTPPVNIKKPLLRPPSPDLLIESEDAGLSSAEMTSHSEYLSTKDEPFGLSLSGSSSAYRSGMRLRRLRVVRLRPTMQRRHIGGCSANKNPKRGGKHCGICDIVWGELGIFTKEKEKAGLYEGMLGTKPPI